MSESIVPPHWHAQLQTHWHCMDRQLSCFNVHDAAVTGIVHIEDRRGVESCEYYKQTKSFDPLTISIPGFDYFLLLKYYVRCNV